MGGHTMPEAQEMMIAIRSEEQTAKQSAGLRITRDASAKRGVYRVQSASNAPHEVNTTVRIISSRMAKIATAR
jgi:hypothetical protein